MFIFKSKRKIAELERHISDLENNLIHDNLTGLNTRAFFQEDVEIFLKIIKEQTIRDKEGVIRRKENMGFRNLSIIFFDIDHFKKINDKYGHDVGDIVLKKVARTIKETLRTGDIVARWGGEEMVASLLGANEADAALKAEEIRQKVKSLEFDKFPELSVTISSGVATSEAGIQLNELMKQADEALYKSKDSGRDKVTVYSSLN